MLGQPRRVKEGGSRVDRDALVVLQVEGLAPVVREDLKVDVLRVRHPFRLEP